MSDHTAAGSGQEPPTVAATAPFTVEQAAAILDVSVTTVKRRIRAGALRAEEAQRPQGTVWLVYLDPAATPPPEERPPAASVAATAPTSQTAPAEAMVSLIQTTIGTVLGPLVAEQAALRQTIERQAETIAELREDRGRQSAELDAARAQISTLTASTAPQSVEPSTASSQPLARVGAAAARPRDTGDRCGTLGVALVSSDTLAARSAGDRRRRLAGGAVVSTEGGLRRLPLEAIEVARPWWRRHRYWLATPMPINGVGAIVINMRTGDVHDWRFDGNRRGRGWFGVRTRWALVHPNWKCDPWVLFYVPVDGALSKPPLKPWWRSWWPWWRSWWPW